MAFLIHIYAFLIDQGLYVNEKLIGRMFKRGEKIHNDSFQHDGKQINEKIRLFAKLGKVLIEAKEAEQDPFVSLQAVIPWNQFVHSVEQAEALARPAEFDYLELLDTYYGQFRKFALRLLQIYTFQSSGMTQTLCEALEILKKLNTSKKRKVPECAPMDFIKSKWLKHVLKEDGIDRHYYEFSVWTELCNHLRSGDIWVPGSKQYKNFDEYLLPVQTWEEIKRKQQIPLSIATNVDEYLQNRDGLLQEQLTEVDSWTHFSQQFVHLHTKTGPKDETALFATILAEGINLGLSKMADACPTVTYTQLVWIADWYISDENYTKALGVLSNFQRQSRHASYWGNGTTSSSDGQYFRASGASSPLAQVNAKHGRNPGLNFYSHISDQYDPFYAQVISSFEEAPHIIDGLLYHEADTRIEEHYTDAAGFVDHVFAMCHMLGFRFSPRIKSIDKTEIYTIDKPSYYPELNFMIGGTIQMKHIRDNWDALLRLISSVQNGTVTASLILKKLASYPRQNSLAVALREIGRIERTLYTLEWLQDPALRRRVQVGLNKGEAKHSLARAVCFHRLGEIRDRSYEDQLHRVNGLQLLISVIVIWNTVYIEKAIELLRLQGMEIPEEYVQHISPIGWEHIALTGDYIWNVQKKTSIHHLRPLRTKYARNRY